MATQDFKTPEDIANRALQILGATRIASFSEASKNASAVLFAYDKLRKAELRRNIWRFACRRNVLRPVTQGTVLFTPVTYSALTTYGLGAIVADSTGDWWQSKLPNNLANTPAQGTNWRRYTGPDSADPWDYTAGTSYFSGETVLVPGAYSSGITYGLGEVVRYATDAKYYVSLQAGNIAHTPSTATTYWKLYQTFVSTALEGALPIYLHTPAVFLCLGSSNTLDPSTSASNWLDLSVASTTNLHLLYPIEAGPATDLSTRNVFRLPRGFLRQAPTDPKANQPSAYLGATISPLADDYVWEENYIVSGIMGTILLRFVSDFVDVAAMDPMFCEMLANRIAEETCEELNQDSGKVSLAVKKYAMMAFEARMVNAIETGPVEPDLDSYIAVRF